VKPPRRAPSKRRGRPQKPENTVLVGALIDRQDEMSRRVARSIAKLLAAHVVDEACVRVWRRLCQAINARLLRLSSDLAPKISRMCDAHDVHTLLEGEIRTALTELAELSVDEPIADLDDIAAEPAPQVRTSTTLASARAQLATLQSQLMNLKARIVPFKQSQFAQLCSGLARGGAE
jgi:hypothetical protein